MPTSDSISIETVHSVDAQEVLEHLDLVAGETSFLSFGRGELTRSREEEAARIEGMSRQGTGFMLKACLPGASTIVGLTTVRWVARSHIRHAGDFALTVVRAWWGKGVGRRLSEQAIERARDAGISRVELRVREDNARAIALYESLGFAKEGRLKGAFRVGERLYDEWFMAALL